MTRSPGLNFVTFAPHVRDHAGRLMPVDSGRREQVVFDLLEIGVADAAGFHANQDFAGADFAAWRPRPPRPRCCRDRRRQAYSGVFVIRDWNVQSARNSPSFFDATAVRCFNRSSSPNRFRGLANAPATRRNVLNWPSGVKRGIKIIFKILAGQIADRANAIERQTQILRRARHPRRFHFYYRCTGRPQVAFFRRSLRNMIDR